MANVQKRSAGPSRRPWDTLPAEGMVFYPISGWSQQFEEKALP